MSNAGQAILTIGGTVIGAYFGNPALGYTLGSMAGSALFPTDLGTVKGPRLEDLRVMSSAIGAPIPLIYGTYAVAGNVIWSGGLIETVHKEEAGGKGGPTQTVKSYSYSVDVALGICEGPIDGVRRIWADAICIYDISEQRTGESDDDFAARLATSQQTQAILQVYLGDETQLADPTIESYEGVGNTPAYRGLAYLVFTGLQLEKYGNRIPNLRVEVFKGILEEGPSCASYSTEVLYPWTEGADDPRNYRNDHGYYLASIGSTYDSAVYTGRTDTAHGGPYELDPTELLHHGGHDFGAYHGWSDDVNTLAGTNRVSSNDYVGGNKYALWLHYNIHSSVDEYSIYSSRFCGAAIGDYGWKIHTGEDYFVFGFNLSHSAIEFRAPAGDCSGTGGYPALWDACINCTGSEKGWIKSDRRLGVVRIPVAPPDTADNTFDYTPIPTAPGYYWEKATGRIVRGLIWTYDNSTTYKVLQKYANTGNLVTGYPLNPTRPLGHADYNDQDFWEAAYAEALAAGYVESGLVYGVDYPETQGYAWLSACETDIAATDCIPVADIVSDLCARAGLTTIDVSDLDTCIEGYAVTRIISARDSIEPLRTIALFDAVESGPVLKFVERGHASVAVLTEEDLGAHVTGDERPSAVQTSRLQEKELPKEVRLHYVSPDRAYEPAQQAAARIATEALGASDIEVTVSMADDAAAQIAEILLYSTWAGRNTCRFAVDSAFLRLEPTDCVVIPVDGNQVRVRIVDAQYSIGGILHLEAVRDDVEIYSSDAAPSVPVANQANPNIAPVCPSDMVLLDLPSLRVEDRDAGYYAAVRGQCGSWQCAVVYRSSDGGATYGVVAETTVEAIIGDLAAAVAGPGSPWDQALSGSPLLFDEATTVYVDLPDYQSLSSATEAQLLAGANTAAIGAHGRWEIIQFRDAVQDISGGWELTGLWRGLLGTSAYMGTTLAADRFVLLSAPGILRIPETFSGIGVEKSLKAVTCGLSIEATDAVLFTTAGLSYVPDALGSIGDVDTTGAVGGATIVFNPVTGRWEARPLYLSESLADVAVGSPLADGASLVWDAGLGMWVPGSPSGGGGYPPALGYSRI